jgi:hypothetical protein
MGLAGGKCSSPKRALDPQDKVEIDALLEDFRKS